jgi:hypothetical protein
LTAAIASAALLVAASLVVGRAAFALCARRESIWLAGPVGLAVLLVVAGAVAGWGGRGTAIAVALGLVLLAAAIVVGLRGPGPGQLAALAAGALAALFASIPFIAAGNVGILGVGLVNDDMASHLLLADWIDERFRPEPVLIDQGYPLGPHAAVAGIAQLLHASSTDVFAGLTLAIPALTALVAFAALDGLRTGWRIAAAALVALPYMAAAYLAQEAFKEPTIALFVLAFAPLLPHTRGRREAIPLGILGAGAVYVYSFPGLAWLAGTALVWGGIELARVRRAPARAVWPAALAAAGVLVVLALPDLDRLRDFVDFRALDPDRANEGGLGNLPGHLSPLQAFGIWPTSDFRASASAASAPAIVFYAGALLAAAALALALPRWLRRYGSAIPAALLTAALLYLAARAFGTVYTSAKALAIIAPLITLLTLGGLWGRREGPPADDRQCLSNAGGPRGGTWMLALGIVVAAAGAVSSFLILRQAPVGPEAHAEELAEIRPLVEGEKLLFLGRDNFILWELRGSKPFVAVRNFYDPYYVKPHLELENVFAKFDFDSVTAETLAQFPYVLTTRAAYASGPPKDYELVKETASYRLWRQLVPPLLRQPGETDAEPGRVGGCDPNEALRNVTTFARPPVVASDWSQATIDGDDLAGIQLDLPRGRWDLSLQYDSTREVTLAAPGFEGSLPGNLDYRGSAPFWPAGTIEAAGGPVQVTATVEEPPAAGRLLGAESVAHLGTLAATAVGEPRPGECRDYVDWYEKR